MPWRAGTQIRMIKIEKEAQLEQADQQGQQQLTRLGQMQQREAQQLSRLLKQTESIQLYF
jgi:hypothetical protein